jgi:DNA-binding transcriptional regulator YhcF (GntR family)
MLDKRTNANYLTVNKALQNKKTVGVTIQRGKKEIIVIDNVAFIKKQKKNNLIISYLNNGFSKVFSLKYSN